VKTVNGKFKPLLFTNDIVLTSSSIKDFKNPIDVEFGSLNVLKPMDSA
jgi:hypothetical protein